MTGRGDNSLLLVVDIQLDFLPGGALAVPDGDAVIEPVRRLLEGGAFDHVVATQDWHPPGHLSFASSHRGREPFETIELYGHQQVLWPDHGVAGSPGATLTPDLPWHRSDAIIRKGMDPGVDSYSAFRNNWNAEGERPGTGLAGFARELGVRQLHVCGLARDFCVRWSAEDAADLGFESYVLWEATRSVDPTGDDTLQRALSDRGVTIV